MKALFGKGEYPDAEISIESLKEKCVLCGKETAYDVQTPVVQRAFYMEGAGQLCRRCYAALDEKIAGS